MYYMNHLKTTTTYRTPSIKHVPLMHLYCLKRVAWLPYYIKNINTQKSILISKSQAWKIVTILVLKKSILINKQILQQNDFNEIIISN